MYTMRLRWWYDHDVSFVYWMCVCLLLFRALACILSSLSLLFCQLARNAKSNFAFVASLSGGVLVLHTQTHEIYIYIMIVCGNCKCVLARWSIHHDARAKRKWTKKITVSCFCPVLACNYNRKIRIRTQQSLSSINMIIIRNQSIYRMCTVAVATKNHNLCNKWDLFDCVPTFLLQILNNEQNQTIHILLGKFHENHV